MPVPYYTCSISSLLKVSHAIPSNKYSCVTSSKRKLTKDSNGHDKRAVKRLNAGPRTSTLSDVSAAAAPTRASSPFCAVAYPKAAIKKLTVTSWMSPTANTPASSTYNPAMKKSISHLQRFIDMIIYNFPLLVPLLLAKRNLPVVDKKGMGQLFASEKNRDLVHHCIRDHLRKWRQNQPSHSRAKPSSVASTSYGSPPEGTAFQRNEVEQKSPGQDSQCSLLHTRT